MSEENMICIDSKLSNSIRKYKEFDNILYAIGVDNIVLGLIKISSVSSEKEEANSTMDDSFLKNLKNTIPVGMYLNGAIAIYNENTFEDFETVLNEQVEKIKELNKELLIGKSEDDIKYLQLALKELLYLDDEDDFTFEFKKLGENTDDSVEVNFSDNLIKKYFSGSDAKYKFLVHHVEVLFNNQKDIDGLENFIELKKEQLSDEKALDDIIDGSKNKGIILKLKQQDLIIDENFDDQQNFTDIKVDEYNKTNSNINKLYYANVQLGVKKNNDDEQIIENIKITDIDLENELKTNLYLETIGVMTSECKDNEKLLKSMLSQLKDNIKNLLQEENKFNQKVILYNELFNSIPFTLSALTPISLADNKLSIKQTKENKTMVKDDIKLSKTFHIDGISFYDFGPILNVPDEKEEKKGDKYQHLLNPHLKISKILDPPSDSHVIRAMVRGDYYYYHYNQDNFNDAGWGCAYRSLQTVISWFILNTSVGKNLKVPTIPEIQTILVKLGDKDKKIIGSTDWIGAIEVNLVLNDLLGIDNQILYVPSGSELNSKGRELLYHFQHNGTPVMVGGGVFAYTILGVDYDKVKGECKFLILDPHYSGEDEIKTIINKGYCNWKTIEIFKKENFYNLCLPLAN
jgi:hypothetical protein